MFHNQFSLNYCSQTSFNGCRTTVLKSGLQKYLRRSEPQKGLWCLIEMDLFSVLEPDSRAYAIRSNNMNRLIAIMSEEISINAPALPVFVRECYETWCNSRGTLSGRNTLVTLYKTLFNCKKSRIISDLKSYYNLPPYSLAFEIQKHLSLFCKF